MIIQAPRQTILRCDAPRCGDIAEIYPITEIEARLWMSKNGWRSTNGNKHFCDRCSKPVAKEAA